MTLSVANKPAAQNSTWEDRHETFSTLVKSRHQGAARNQSIATIGVLMLPGANSL
jgi:hypothetical protein